MSKIGWFINRLKVMELPFELFYRINQQKQTQLHDKLRAKRSDQKVKISPIGKLNSRYSIEGLNKIFNSDQNYKEYSYFDHTIPNIQEITKWRDDLKHNINSPIRFYDSFNSQDFNGVGDIKYVHEVSRFHHLPVLASKSIVEGNKNGKLPQQQITEWIHQNPYLQSINWTSGIEVGIRAINWVYSLSILQMAPEFKQEADDEISRSIYEHAHYLIHHLSRYSSANNHLLAELAGLIVICCNYEFKEHKKWLSKSTKMLFRELEDQVHEDGFNKEQSTHYHALSFELFLVSIQNLKLHGVEIPQKVLDKMKVMSNFMNYLFENGSIQEMGDSDDGHVFYPYFDKRFSIYHSMMTSSAILFKDASFVDSKSRIDLSNYLFFGDNSTILLNELSSKTSSLKSQLFKDSGYCIYKEENSTLIFDIGQIGMEPMAAHGHSDLLSFTLSVHGIPYIIDPGTFQYHEKDAFWRNYFKGTNAHNTISINDLDQAQSGGRFIWLNKPAASLIDFVNDNNHISCKASHNGFKKQGVPCLHSRRIEFNRSTAEYVIYDELATSSPVTASFYLHFDPHLKDVELVKDSALLLTEDGNCVTLENEYFSRAKLYKGDADLPLGWCSPSFDIKQPTWSLKFQLEIKGKETIVTRIDIKNATQS